MQTTSSPASRRQLLIAGGIGLAVMALTSALPSNHFTAGGGGGDVVLYERYGTNVVNGMLPYHDFFFEYPPVAIVALVVPKLTGLTYAVAFRSTMLLLLAAILALVLLTLERLGADAIRVFGAALLVGATPILIGPVFFERFDAWPAFLLSTAILLVLSRRTAPGAIALTLAVCAKVYPVVAVPALLLHALATRGRSAVTRAIAAGLAVGAVVVIPFAVVGFGGLGFSFYVQFKRPLQIESLGASVLLALDRLGLYTAHPHAGLSRDLQGSVPQAVALISSVVQLAAILLAVWWFARGSRSAAATTTAVAAAVAAFITFGKVLSPQYLVWLVPLVPLVARPVWMKAMLLAAGAMAMTHVYFPSRYDGIYGLTNWIWLLLVRNIALVALTLVLLRQLHREAGQRGVHNENPPNTSRT